MIDWDKNVLVGVHSVFGENVTYSPATGGSFQVQGIFDAATREVDPMTGVYVTTANPCLGVRLSQFADPPKQGDTVEVPSVSKTFVVKEVRPDSHGEARLMLNRVA